MAHLSDMEKIANDPIWEQTSDETEDDANFDYNNDHDSNSDEETKRRSSAIHPTAGSPLRQELDRLKKKIMDGGTRVGSNRWICPTTGDPSVSAKLNAASWIKSKVWVYLWTPVDQYHIPTNTLKCPHCESTGMKKKDTAFRPMFCLDKVVWVFHNRLQCKSCRKTWAEIDPVFLATLPRFYVERFEFVPTRHGPGMHKSLLYSFISLADKGILFSQFTKMVNEVAAIDYTETQLAQLDALHQLHTGPGLHTLDEAPTLIGHQFDKSGWGGIRVLAQVLQLQKSQQAPAIDALHEGMEVLIEVGRSKKIARGIVRHVGGSGGETRYWGGTTIGKGKSIVEVLEVFAPSQRPYFNFEHSTDPTRSWKKSDVTIAELLNDHRRVADDPNSGIELPFFTRSLRISIDTSESIQRFISEVEVVSPTETAPGNAVVEEPADDESPMGEAATQAAQQTISDAIESIPVEDPEAESIGGLRSRIKGDIWHDYHGLPIPHSCPAGSTIVNMIIHATLEFVWEDLEPVKLHVESNGVDDWLKHFRYNREWWRQRVRMLAPSAEEHAARIRAVRKFIMSNKELKVFFTKDVEKYFDTLESNALQGFYEEIDEINLFRPTGKDGNGLQLWIRFRGSVRNENGHQKLSLMVGPYPVGPEVGHYLNVLICYKYNVSCGIKRLGHHDFGHSMLHLVDRIQNRYHELFDIFIYPRHRNLSQFKGIDDFVCVGIGPLSFDSKYVTKGPPIKELKGQVKWLAQQMKVKCPPLPMCGTYEENKLFKDFIERHPKMTDKDIRLLAEKFHFHADGVKVFPKLPSMIKAHVHTWQNGEGRRNIEATIENEAHAFIESLQRGKEILPPTGPPQVTRPHGIDGSRQELMVVPPASAPTQTTVIEPTIAQKSRDSTKACFYAPFCKKQRGECRGYSKGRCTEVNSGRVALPDDWQQQKENYIKKRRAQQSKEARKRAKEATVS